MAKIGGLDRKALVGFIVEIEASRDRAKGETRHQSEIFKTAREKGFEPKAMRKVLQRRAMSAVDLYEHALGALADAREAVEGGMSAREAAEKFDVPRAALGVIARGSQNAIFDPATPTHEMGAEHATSFATGNSAHEGEEDGIHAVSTEADRGASAVESGGRNDEGQRVGGRRQGGQSEAQRHDRPEPEEPQVSMAGVGDVLRGQLRAGVASPPAITIPTREGEREGPDLCPECGEPVHDGACYDQVQYETPETMAWLESQPEVIASRAAVELERRRGVEGASTPPLDAVAEGDSPQRVAPPTLSNMETVDDGLDIPIFLRRVVVAPASPAQLDEREERAAQ